MAIFSDLPSMLEVPFFGVPFRILALSLLVLLAAILFKNLLTDLLFAGLKRLTERTAATWDDNLLKALQKPAANFVLILGIYISLNLLPLDDNARKIISNLFYAATTISVFWALIRATAVGAEILTEYGRQKGLAVATFVPLFRQIVIIILAIIGVVMIIDNLGYSVSSIIAALGIGGAAIAFASQNTIANMYGSVAIALDRPFKVGDAVKVGTIEGTVEAIGLRSTQIRTFTKSLVSIPNNTIANEAIDNYTQIQQRRILTNLSIVYGTTQTQIEAILTDLRAMLQAMPQEVATPTISVHLSALGESGITIELVCYTLSADYNQFLAIRQRVLLGAMAIVERHGSALAYPTRTLHVNGMTKV